MSSLSANNSQWPTVKFGDVVRNVRETEHEPLENGLERYVGLGDIEPEDLHIRSWGMIEDGTSFTRLFREGQVLFARRRAYQRKVAVAEWDGLCSGDLMVFEPKPDRNGDVRLLPELLPFIVQSEPFFQYVLDMSQGSLSPRVKWKDLAQYEFALPPLEEQRRIADILWAADTTSQKHDNVLQELVNLKESLLRFLFQSGIHHTKVKKAELGPVPIKWQVVPLDEVVEFLDSERVPLSKKVRSERQGPYPYYGASGIIDWIDDYLFDEPLILVGEDGANLLDRNSPLAFRVDGKIWVNNHAHVLRVKGVNNIDFYSEFLESISYEPYVTGTAQPKLTQRALAKIPVPLPPPTEQNEIAHVVGQFNDQIKSQRIHLGKLTDLRKALAIDLVNGTNNAIQ